MRHNRVVPAELFVDTSAWRALADAKTLASKHVEAELRRRFKLRVRIVNTNFIVTEALTLDHHFAATGVVMVPAVN